MSRYALEFVPRARRAWSKLDPETRRRLAQRLAERQEQPVVASAALRGMPGCYKIKLKSPGIRLVYRVEDDRLVILVLALGMRERNEVYVEAGREFRKLHDRH